MSWYSEDSEAALEQALYRKKDSIRADPAAPARFAIERNLFGEESPIGFWRQITWLAGVFPFMGAIMGDIVTSFRSLEENPAEPKTEISAERLRDLEAQAHSLGIGGIGYTRLPREAIFKEKAVMYDSAMVLLFEMDAGKIAKAPSWVTLRMVMKSYHELGRIVARLVDDLRRDGYAAQGGHPLNGVTLYPLIAQHAGLGWCGSHGLLIAPGFGPRHRIAAIYTPIQNLPLAEKNEHAWIEELCRRCGQCRRKCPGRAIYEEPIRHPSGIVTHVDVDRCFPVFAEQYGCSVCIKVCPFNRHPYEHIKQAFLRARERAGTKSLGEQEVRPAPLPQAYRQRDSVPEP
jgi:epoxyqueuosine reductase